MIALKKTTTRDAQWAIATHEVLMHGKVIGTVTKYDMPGEKNLAGNRRPHYAPCRAIRWSADICGINDADAELHERRKDAVDLLLHTVKEA